MHLHSQYFDVGIRKTGLICNRLCKTVQIYWILGSLVLAHSAILKTACRALFLGFDQQSTSYSLFRQEP